MTGFELLVAGVLLGGPQAASSLPPEPQDPDRPRVSLRDFKGLRENNIFAPARPPRREHRTSSSPAPPPPSPPAPAKPRPPLVTGFVFSETDQVWQVLVEDRNTDLKLKLFAQPRFLRAGEEFLEYKIESVTEQAVTVRAGDTVRELRLGDSFPERSGTPAGSPAPSSEGTSSAASPEAAEAPPAAAPAKPEDVSSPGNEGDRSRVLEELKKRYKKRREDLDFQEP